MIERWLTSKILGEGGGRDQHGHRDQWGGHHQHKTPLPAGLFYRASILWQFLSTPFMKQVVEIQEYRGQLYEYLKNRMMAIAPNLTVLVGELVGARLIAHAGTLMNLAKHPASTVQILGAEKALFKVSEWWKSFFCKESWCNVHTRPTGLLVLRGLGQWCVLS